MSEGGATPPPGLVVLYADEALVVVDKPAGLLSVPGRGEAGRENAAARVQALWPDALVVHRLDMGTSGLLVFARGAAVQRALGIAFIERRVAKHYVAVIAGELQPPEGEISLPLAADWPNRPRQKVDAEHGRPSTTRYRVISHDVVAGTSRVALEPLTGRSHQLRVHLQAIGHPILGDALYAPPRVLALAPRLLLHAERLAFEHPLTGRPIAFDCPAPF